MNLVSREGNNWNLIKFDLVRYRGWWKKDMDKGERFLFFVSMEMILLICLLNFFTFQQKLSAEEFTT